MRTGQGGEVCVSLLSQWLIAAAHKKCEPGNRRYMCRISSLHFHIWHNTLCVPILTVF